MNNSRLIAFLFFVFVSGCSSDTTASSLCVNERATIKCAVDNFDSLYQENSNKFWAIFHNSEKTIKSRESIPESVAFLNSAKVKKGNAEFNEYFQEVLETYFCDDGSEILFKAWPSVDRASKSVILNDLKTPMFISPRKTQSILERLR